MEVTIKHKEPRLLALAKSIRDYIEVSKPRSVFLLVFTSIVTMFIAAEGIHLPVLLWLKAIASITLACSGVNAISCYVDRDLDAGMERTKRRPIPDGRISPAIKALYWGMAHFLAAMIIAYSINLAAFTCIILGMAGYVGLYSLWLKRKTVWNIILGGFSGGLPALFGWVCVTGKVDPLSLLIAVLVVLWIPNHIWNLAIYFKDDYRIVKVPMLPTVYSIKTTLIYILLTVVLMIGVSMLIYIYGGFGSVYFWTALISGLAILAGNLYLFFCYLNKKAWLLYKLSSPYLFLLFMAMLVDRLVH
ncbi:MAG: Protoheme IX farnesyltransferase [Desulfotomaculum sp. 46_296]|nr:MAG: Protoheme IX farnesyltransferase [Desulfotomaculum sp. 46_296]